MLIDFSIEIKIARQEWVSPKALANKEVVCFYICMDLGVLGFVIKVV